MGEASCTPTGQRDGEGKDALVRPSLEKASGGPVLGTSAKGKMKN